MTLKKKNVLNSAGSGVEDKSAKEGVEKSSNNEGPGHVNAEKDLVPGVLKSTAYNIITQISLRIITFLLNAFVLHRVNREVLGLINMRLTLLGDTIIFLSREAFRLACQAHTPSQSGWSEVLNLMWLSVPVSVMCSLLFSWIWISLLSSPSDEQLTEQYTESVLVVATSIVIQMLAEAPSLVAQIFQFIRLRVVLEFLLMAVKLFVLVYAVSFAPENVVQVWSYGHLLSSIIYTLGFYTAFALILKYGNNKSRTSCGHSKSTTSCGHSSHQQLPFASVRQLLPILSPEGHYKIHEKYRDVAVSFLGQGIMKQMLTEGERYLMTFFNLLSLSQQGTYDVISNLGSLACRFIFRPVEENAYFFFSQQWQRGVLWKQQDTKSRENVRVGLYRLLRISLLLGIIILIFGYSYSDLLLTLYGGNKLSGDGGTSLLRAQCLLVACFAVNGITECFARTVMTEDQINKFNLNLVYLSCVYLAATWAFTLLLGPVGTVLANAANIGIRICISLAIIKSTFQDCRMENPVNGLYPDTDIMFLLLSTGTCLQLSEIYLYFWHPWIHLSIGVLLGAIVVMAIVLKEEFVFIFILENVKKVLGLKPKFE